MADGQNTRVWDAIMRRVKKAGGMRVKVGVLGGAGEEDGISIVEIAAIHEFGSPAANIPQRSFIRRALVWHSGPWLPAFVAKLAGAVVAGKMDERRALGLLGQRAVVEVRKTITSTDIPPPLQPATIARKGSSRPLVDTGRLVGSIASEVVET